MKYGFQVVVNNLAILLWGSINLRNYIFSILIGMVLGLIAALGRMSRMKIINFISVSYIDFFRGTPLFVQILLLYFGVIPLVFDATRTSRHYSLRFE